MTQLGPALRCVRPPRSRRCATTRIAAPATRQTVQAQPDPRRSHEAEPAGRTRSHPRPAGRCPGAPRPSPPDRRGGAAATTAHDRPQPSSQPRSALPTGHGRPPVHAAAAAPRSADTRPSSKARPRWSESAPGRTPSRIASTCAGSSSSRRRPSILAKTVAAGSRVHCGPNRLDRSKHARHGTLVTTLLRSTENRLNLRQQPHPALKREQRTAHRRQRLLDEWVITRLHPTPPAHQTDRPTRTPQSVATARTAAVADGGRCCGAFLGLRPGLADGDIGAA